MPPQPPSGVIILPKGATYQDVADLRARLNAFPQMVVVPSPFVTPNAPPLNLDRFGMPRDFATYMWVVYRERADDDSPERRAFLHGPVGIPDFGQQMAMR